MNLINTSHMPTNNVLNGLVHKLTFILICIVLLTSAAAADTRVALVIGNSDYEFAADLANPLNDAEQIKVSLETIGFEVSSAFNLGHAEMLSALRRFKKVARGADIATIYYAGHGIEVQQRNYLVPIDASFEDEDDAEFNMVSLDLLSSSMSGVAGISMIMLDACRDNPFANGRSIAGSRGLAPVEPVRGTLISYAARAGTKASDGDGQNSPYAKALIKHLQENQVDIRRVFDKVRDTVMSETNNKQEPFVYASLPAKDIFLNENQRAQRLSSSNETTNIELKYWSSVEQSGSPELLQSYLDKYPEGEFVAIATFKLEKLLSVNTDSEPSEQSTKTVPAALNSEEVEKVKYYRLAANQGQAYSQYLLGRAYETGKGVEQDYQEAARWYNLAADQGYAAAQYEIGEIYYHARGVEKDIKTSFKWHSRASDQGYAASIARLGEFYGFGEVVEKDTKKAIELFEKAVALEDPSAMVFLGWHYQSGDGVEEDKKKAVEYFRKSAAKGYMEAFASLGGVYETGSGVEKDINKAIEFYKLGMSKNDPFAFSALAGLYKTGEGVEKSLEKAFNLYKKSADINYAYKEDFAQFTTAEMYENGTGTEKNMAAAIKYYKIAANNGNEEAKKRLSELGLKSE